ncbi:MAG: hypothetical protein ABEJ72_11290, partial [Candidatus Aenigmatarchaeota archaeon]
MTVLLNGKFRKYLELETRMSDREIRNARRLIRNLALKHSRVEEVDRSSLEDFERQVLELFIDYRMSHSPAADLLNLHV